MLATGTRLGPYEILEPIGAGGMGEVYKARDTRLDRTVAVKVLPSNLAADTERRQRFEREARAVAALNHPHICTLHDIGRQDGVDFLVMEFLEGETLAARLAGGPLPLDQLLRRGVETADALAQAHRKSVYHRDLKPANIMLTKAGAKLLDFGLAKHQLEVDAPTRSVELTRDGVVMGTLHYMAPEQLLGKPADARSDVYAFGAVLYEAATGRKAHEGLSETVAPPALDRVIRSCLAKDPDERWQSAQDLKRQLEWLADASTAAPAAAAKPAASRLAWIAAAVLLVATVGLAVAYFRRPPPETRVLKLTMLPPDDTAFGEWLAISPDGTRLAFTALSQGRTQLWVRRLDSVSAQALAGADGALLPFWSPDSRFIGFFADGKLKKIEAGGGPPQILCDAQAGTGGTWNRDGVIVFASGRFSGLYRVQASGGEATPVTALERSRQEISHRFPYFLPGGRKFLYYLRSGQPDKTGIYAQELSSKDGKRILASESMAVHVAPRDGAAGYLLFTRQRTLLAQPFDADRLELSGEPTPLAEGTPTSFFVAYRPFTVSANGILAYRTGVPASTQLTWFDRNGKTLGKVGGVAFSINIALSLDAKRLAEVRVDPSGEMDVWVSELARGATSRFTFDPGIERLPAWSPDGTRIAYSADREGLADIYQKLASGAGGDELLVKGGGMKYATDWSRDGRFIMYQAAGEKTRYDLWLLPMEGDRKPVLFLQTPFDETRARFSPDGKWIAYSSDETSRMEVYVRPFSASGGGAGGRWQVSTGGGEEPLWRGDGKEIFYLALDGKLMAVDVKAAGSAFQVGVPRALFQTSVVVISPLANRYAVTADGSRFLVTATIGAELAPLTVVSNWTAALRR